MGTTSLGNLTNLIVKRSNLLGLFLMNVLPKAIEFRESELSYLLIIALTHM
ncbi:Uncharacterised protein [Lederbergia lenta]|uniref:Uncharacterized protein n=1 Tax=Lederbergia lenta TaxID=1467 RepID=A0A2X4WCD0_LEDLE|nr:Uncharacterised protein [Lederbergia lenta]